MESSPTYKRFLAFGELLLRLSSQRGELLSSSRCLDVDVGGSEANVAAALAMVGHCCGLISAVPDSALGDAAVTAVRSRGVDCQHVLRGRGRMGLYWLERGAGKRPADVIYDREHSAFATMDPAVWAWDQILLGAERLHLSGITPALGSTTTVMIRQAIVAARKLNVPISFDGNYRAQLWAARGGVAVESLVELASSADILFGNHRDISLFLGTPLAGDTIEDRRAASEAAFAAFPRLRLIASTKRFTHHADRHSLSVRVDTRLAGYETEETSIPDVVDRIGSGDAFAAGILHADRHGLSVEEIAASGLAFGVLKHTVKGDMMSISHRHLSRPLSDSMDVNR